MKRICLVGAAMAGLLTAGITTAASAKPSPAAKKPAKTKTTVKKPVTAKLSCSLSLVTQVPSNDVAITQGALTGTQYGFAGCGRPLFKGMERVTFSTDASGVITGKYQQWFNPGSVYGTYTLTPVAQSTPPTTSSFTSQSYTGTITVSNGTGAYARAAGKGTLSCSTTDAAHYACKEALKLTTSP